MEKNYSDLTLEEKVERHMRLAKNEMVRYISLCRTLDNAYVPVERMTTSGAWDTHPYDRVKGQAHVSIPLVYLTVNAKSNILGMRPPKFNIRPLDRKDDKQRADASFIEVLIDKLFVDENMEDVHMNMNRNLSLYGRAVLQDGKDFTHNIDMQANLWVSYASVGKPEAFSFVEMVSPKEAMDMGWDGNTAYDPLRVTFPIYGGYTHDDPLGVLSNNWISRDRVLVNAKVPVLHFYSKLNDKTVVRYSLIINGQIIKSEISTGRKSWPFIVIECEHVPGTNIGVGDAEPILDLQAEMSERLTAWSEAVRRTIKDQWKAWGLQHLNPRILPGNGQIWEMNDKTEEDIEPLKFVTNDAGVHMYIEALWQVYRRLTGIPSEVEAQSLSHTSGYAMNVKYQSLIINLSARKIRQQRAYRQWALDKLDLIKLQYPDKAYLIEDAKFILEVDWEEITPSDMQTETSRLGQAVQLKITSPYTAMEQLNLVPEDEIRLMEEFWVNPKINPQGAMAEAQAMLMLQQTAQQGGPVQPNATQPNGGGITPQQAVQSGQQSALFAADQGFPRSQNPTNVRTPIVAGNSTGVVQKMV